MKCRISKEEIEKHFPGIKVRFDNIVMEGEKIDDKRTSPQNNALHLYFAKLSKAFNDAGLDMKAVLKPEIDIDWTPSAIKDYIWRPIQKWLFKTTSTTKLKKNGDIELIHDHINRFLAKNPKTQSLPHVPFPSLENKDKELPDIEYPDNNLGEPKF